MDQLPPDSHCAIRSHTTSSGSGLVPSTTTFATGCCVICTEICWRWLSLPFTLVTRYVMISEPAWPGFWTVWTPSLVFGSWIVCTGGAMLCVTVMTETPVRLTSTCMPGVIAACGPGLTE